jgi:hypothetical protein
VLPGDYTIALNVAGHELKRVVKVEMDPRTEVPMSDLTTQLETSLVLRDLSERVTPTIDRTNDAIQQLRSER